MTASSFTYTRTGALGPCLTRMSSPAHRRRLFLADCCDCEIAESLRRVELLNPRLGFVAMICLIFVPLVSACTPSVKIPSDAWQFLYNAEKYRDRALGTVKDLAAIKDTVPDEYADARTAYHDARGKWNAWIDNVQTLILARRDISEWSKFPEAAREAGAAAEAFFASSDHAVAKYRNVISAGAKPPVAMGGTSPSLINLPINLPVPTWDQLVSVWKEIMTRSKEQRDQIVAELEKRKWPKFECVSSPLDASCIVPTQQPPSPK